MKSMIKKVIERIVFQTRTDKLVFTQQARFQMSKYGLNEADIQDAWRWGKQEIGEKIVRKFSEYTVVLVVKDNEDEHVLVTCWKYKNWK